MSTDSSVGAGIDSYYEYCLKAYILLGDEMYLERFNRVCRLLSLLIFIFLLCSRMSVYLPLKVLSTQFNLTNVLYSLSLHTMKLDKTKFPIPVLLHWFGIDMGVLALYWIVWAWYHFVACDRANGGLFSGFLGLLSSKTKRSKF